jgi:NTP pyrophosphatase (non-canonical NTP hydrolase)
MDEIKTITERIKNFRDERDWLKFHNHKDMAISLILEVAELLEHFQWKSSEEAIVSARDNKEAISEELADIAIYLFELADNLEVDLGNAIYRKLEHNSKKYPVEKAKGKHTKYNKL